MRRIWIVFFILVSVYLGILIRLFYWQVIESDRLRVEAAKQYALTLTLPASRGAITDTSGTSLVMSQPASLVYASPAIIKDPITFVDKVASVLPVDSKDLLGSLGQKGRVWVPVAHKVNNEVSEKLKALRLDGLGFENDSLRYYPEGSMAAQLLGFVGSDENGNDKGYFGLEGFYDRELHGKDGVIAIEKDVRGAPIVIGDTKRIEPEHGSTIRLWLDRTVQYDAEQRLREGIEKYGAKEGTVTIMDPKTGGILAMASYPSYDPSQFTQFPKDVYKNPIVASSYEPGSTFKVLVMSTALDHKLVTPDTVIDESGPAQVGEYSIRTWNNQYHGNITTTKVLEYSSNVGMVSVSKLLGKDLQLSGIHAFGIGKETGIDLEEESSPELRSDNDWKPIDLATASFGQGIAVTPIQMVRAVGALANDGKLMEPHVARQIIDQKGRVIDIKPKQLRQVISPATSHIITEMMIAAVDNGEAKWAKPRGYRIAGKTGTAQIPVAGHYDDKKTIASFVGFAPADDPKFVMLVTLQEPTSSPWGSETAAPLFFNIAKDLFVYYGIAPQ